MTDIHTHVLPFVDDGSASLAHSLEMLKEEVSQGVKQVVLTPHYRRPYLKSAKELQEAFEKFKQQVADAGIQVELFLGQEFTVNRDTKKVFKNKQFLTLGGAKYVLLEFDFTREWDIVETVHEVKCMGLTAIVAHPERYKYLKLDDAYEIKNVGGMLQVNADSIVNGKWRIKRMVRDMFKNGLVDFVASDMHFGRNNCMQEAYKIVTQKYGMEAAEVVFNLNGKHVLKG